MAEPATSTTVVVPSVATGGSEVWTCEARAFDGVLYGPWASASVDISCPPGSGQGDACAGASCADILLTGTAHGSARYWLDPTDSGAPYEVWCDMEAEGGGWTMVLQTAELSELTYSHRAWGDPSFATPLLWDLGADVDAVSPAFYELIGTQTRLCLPSAVDGSWTCDQVDHLPSTATALATGPVIPTAITTRNLVTDAMLAVVPGGTVYSVNSQRWGWNHGTDRCGGARLGWSGDGDSTDSRDAAIGVGFHVYTSMINCNPKEYANLTTGSGYYHFPWGGNPPNHPTPPARALPAQVWLR